MTAITRSTWALTGGRFKTFQFEPAILSEIAKLRPDNITGALYVAKDYAVMVAFALLSAKVSWWFYPLTALVIGAHQRGLTTIAHDAAHRTLARSKVINYGLGIIFAAYPLLQRHWAYRISHVHFHHQHLGDPEKDPDLQFFIKSGVYRTASPARYFRRLVIYPVLGLATFAYLKFIIRHRFFVSQTNAAPAGRAAFLCDTVGFYGFWALVVGGSVVLGWWHYLLLFWIVPFLTTFQVLGWFVELAEHTPLCETQVESIYLTRNRKGNLLERLLLGVNLDEYHLEHHLSPGVPFWHLKKTQRIRLQNEEYAKVAKTWGGIFVRGPHGGQSVIGQLLERNRRLYGAEALPSAA